MNKRKFISYITFLCFLFNVINSHKDKYNYRCGATDLKIKPKTLGNKIPIDQNSTLYKRRLDSNGFKNLNIYFDLTNFLKELEMYNLNRYKNLFLSSFNKAIKTLESLFKVKPLKYKYIYDDEVIRDMGINYWEKDKFGSSSKYSLYDLGIDLLIFGRFKSQEDLGQYVLASAGAYHYEKETGLPIDGIVYINKDLDYSDLQTKEYFESIILHEFIHVLGFSSFFFVNVFHNILIDEDKFGIERYYINSAKVINVAKKYYNCNNIKGIELEESGGQGIVGSHWESRILLGEIMNGDIYPEEQVISEFTLAVLEDSGLYKANYYTGGLMRYGKNKGCDFLYEKCVNNGEINPMFENEFFDYYNSGNDPSCSSGRQSRTYNLLYIYDEVPEIYQYYHNKSYGGLYSGDYCPSVSSFSYETFYGGYYVGQCSSKGNRGEYGSIIRYLNNTNTSNASNTSNNEELYFRSIDIQSIIGEKYSDNSFCYLSSLIKNGKNYYNIFSKTVRSVCYETFCSSRSLTIKIDNDYIVCPREGGKIKVTNYEGYLLCPDYNLMCSGTVLCNDMFDCVEKKSEIKDNAYTYDYKIKTSQNIPISEEQEENNKTNYELSDDGKCPK